MPSLVWNSEDATSMPITTCSTDKKVENTGFVKRATGTRQKAAELAPRPEGEAKRVKPLHRLAAKLHHGTTRHGTVYGSLF